MKRINNSEQEYMLQFIIWCLSTRGELCTKDIEKDLIDTGFYSMVVNRWDEIRPACFKPFGNDVMMTKEFDCLQYIAKQLDQNGFIIASEENQDKLLETGVLQMLLNHWDCTINKTHILIVTRS